MIVMAMRMVFTVAVFVIVVMLMTMGMAVIMAVRCTTAVTVIMTMCPNYAFEQYPICPCLFQAMARQTSAAGYFTESMVFSKELTGLTWSSRTTRLAKNTVWAPSTRKRVSTSMVLHRLLYITTTSR